MAQGPGERSLYQDLPAKHSQYSSLRFTKLYKIENFHHEVQAKGVGRFIGGA